MTPLAYENIEIVTRSHPDAFPSALRQKRKTQTKVHAANEDLLKVRRPSLRSQIKNLSRRPCMQVTEKCPECGHMEAYSKEAQVRTPRSPRIIVRTTLTRLTPRPQLRSADEGSTIFYTVRGTFSSSHVRDRLTLLACLCVPQCVKCKFGWRVNN